MPRHRSLNLKKFVESIPSPLMEEYFKRKVGEADSSALTAFDFESVNSFLDSLKEEQKNSIREDFTIINDICEKSMNILVHTFEIKNIKKTGDEERQELAMTLFLHHGKAFEYAYDLYCLNNASSKMSHHNIKADGFKITNEKINNFKEKIKAFYSNLAKGQECIIRHYDEENQTIIVVIRGSYRRSVVIWVDQQPKTFHYRPANEDILQFNKNNSVLLIKTPHQKDKENYIKAFTETIIEDKSQAERPDRDATYTLEPLQKGTFNFMGNEKILTIILLKIKLLMRGTSNTEITVKSKNVLKTLEEEVDGLRLDSGDLVLARFRFILRIDGKSKQITFEVGTPNITDLNKKQYADIISDYLKENGVKLF